MKDKGESNFKFDDESYDEDEYRRWQKHMKIQAQPKQTKKVGDHLGGHQYFSEIKNQFFTDKNLDVDISAVDIFSQITRPFHMRCG